MTARPPGRDGSELGRSASIATLFIVTTFVAVGAVSLLHLGRLDRAARELSSSIAPRIECLTISRGLVHELARTLSLRPEVTRAQLAAAHARLRRELPRCDAAAALPALSAWLDADARVVADPVAARAAVDAADEALERAMQGEAARAAAVGRAIGEARNRAWRTSVGVHSLAAIIALLAVGIVWLASRSQARWARERMELAARERRAATERARELELFASRVAHDLKSPLSAVLLYLRGAARRPATSEGREIVEETIAGTIDIVDALLDYARSAGPPPADATADVGEVVDHVVRSLVPTWRRAGARLRVDVEPGVAVVCHRGGLASIVANLVRNAFEHAVAGGARAIVVRARRRGDRVRIEVSDDGPGVPRALVPTIFDAYVRGDGERAGLGLGLATVRRFAEGCGGAVGVESPAHGGACFWVELPASARVAAAERELDAGGEQDDVHAERG